jgi:hypothetical protein
VQANPQPTPKQATASVAGVVTLADVAAITAGTAGRVVDAAQVKAQYIAKGEALYMHSVNGITGASVGFTNIPAWAKRISILLNGVQTTAPGGLVIIKIADQVGLVGGYAAKMQLIGAGGPAGGAITSGFYASANMQPTDVRDGRVDISLVSVSGASYVYAASGAVGIAAPDMSKTNATLSYGGVATANGAISAVYVQIDSAATFAGGNIGFTYEG